MQEKANMITAKFDDHANIASDYIDNTDANIHSTNNSNNEIHNNTAAGTTFVPKDTLDRNSRPFNPLFPDVDPLSIGNHRQQYQSPANSRVFDPDLRQNTATHKQLHDNEYVFNSQHFFVNTNTFYKLKWGTRCAGEGDIMSFYESLQHMASTCGIPLRDLDDIDEHNGVCPLNVDNYQNFEKVYKLMKGAVFYKINDESLWKGYKQGWNLVKSNLLNCDGFEVLYDILSEVLPKLNINTPKRVKLPRPVYNTRTDDNVYTYINDYNSFLKFEFLENNKRTYSPFEIAVYVADDLEKDPHKRFDKGIDYIRSQLKHSTDGINVPRDISLTKIGKTVCKYSSEYVVGEHADVITPTINATKLPYKPKHRQSNYSNLRNKRPTRDMSLKCQFCGQLGHDADSVDGCFIFAKWCLCQQASIRVSESDIQSNTRKFLKSIKQRQTTAKYNEKLTRHIKSLEALDQYVDTTTLIHSLRLMQDDSSNSDGSGYSSDEE